MLEASCLGLTFSPAGHILSRFMDLDPASSLPSILKAMPREPLRLLAAFPSVGCAQAELMRRQHEATRASMVSHWRRRLRANNSMGEMSFHIPTADSQCIHLVHNTLRL